MKENLFKNPFKGFNHYSEKDAYFFCGRDKERDILISSLFGSRLTLLCGSSGVGKTSLLYAGVIHKLKSITNSKLGKDGKPEFITIMFRTWSIDPILGLVSAIKESLAKFCTNEQLTEVIDNMSIKNTLQSVCNLLKNSYLLIILDQFDEYFSYQKNDQQYKLFAEDLAYIIEETKLKVNFLISIREDFLPELDYFSELIPEIFNTFIRVKPLGYEDWELIINTIVNKFNDTKTLLEVEIEANLISKVLNEVAEIRFSETGKGKIKRNEDKYIPTPFLQQVMFRLWNELFKSKKSDITSSLISEAIMAHVIPPLNEVTPAIKKGISENKDRQKIKIGLETLSNIGGSKKIIEEYLNEAITTLEADQKILADIFYYLVTPSCRKIAQTPIDLHKFTGNSKEKIITLLDTLSSSNNRILRVINSSSDPDTKQYEIFHDVLCEHVLEWRKKYLAEYQEERDKTFEAIESIFNFEIEGTGEAFFTSPEGIVKGSARICFDEFGNSTVEINVDFIDSAHAMEVGAMQFFSGQTPWHTKNTVGISLGGRSQNRCKELIVKTDKGIFHCAKKYGSSSDLIYSYTVGSEVSIKFNISVSQFDFNNQNTPKYWLLPLANFISDFVQDDFALKKHPLRSSTESRLIIFEFNKSFAFIEPLNKYKQLKEELIKNKSSPRITAIMVGEVGENPTDTYDDLKKWFPFELISCIELASGAEVSVSKVHLCDETGNLVKYIHLGKSNISYLENHRVIEEYTNHAGTGVLLTKYIEFKGKREKSFPLISLVRNLLTISSNKRTVEDKFLAAVRAFASLNNYYGYNEELFVGKEKETFEYIKMFSISLSAKLFSSKETNWLHKLRGFGVNIYAMVNKFELNDIVIMEKYYKRHYLNKDISWGQDLSKLFDVITEKGFFDAEDVLKVFLLTRHLHDLIVRVIFKTIGYEGTYQPIISGYANVADCDANWIKPNTKPTWLDALNYSLSGELDEDDD